MAGRKRKDTEPITNNKKVNTGIGYFSDDDVEYNDDSDSSSFEDEYYEDDGYDSQAPAEQQSSKKPYSSNADYQYAKRVVKSKQVMEYNTSYTPLLCTAAKYGDKELMDDLLTKIGDDSMQAIADFPHEVCALHVVVQTQKEPVAYKLVKCLYFGLYTPLIEYRKRHSRRFSSLDSLQVAVMNKLYQVVWHLVGRGVWINETCMVEGKAKTIWELSGGDDATRNSLLHFWTPQNHHLHKPRVREAIVTLLLVAKRNKWKFDVNIMRRIIGYLAYETKWKENRKAEWEISKPALFFEIEDQLPKPNRAEDCWIKSAGSNSFVRWRALVEFDKDEFDPKFGAADGDDAFDNGTDEDEDYEWDCDCCCN